MRCKTQSLIFWCISVIFLHWFIPPFPLLTLYLSAAFICISELNTLWCWCWNVGSESQIPRTPGMSGADIHKETNGLSLLEWCLYMLQYIIKHLEAYKMVWISMPCDRGIHKSRRGKISLISLCALPDICQGCLCPVSLTQIFSALFCPLCHPCSIISFA